MKKWLFFIQNRKIMTKKAIFSWIRPYKKTKNPKIQKSLCAILEGTLGYIYTKNLVNWTFFLETHKLSGKVFFPNFYRVGKKMGVFCPKIGQFLVKIYKILEINKNHLNTQYVQIMGHLKHFWAQNSNFCPFLGHFSPYYFIRESAGRRLYLLSRYRP